MTKLNSSIEEPKGDQTLGKRDTRSRINLAELTLAVPPDVRTLWVDRMSISMRDDGIATLGFETAVPEMNARVQVARLQASPKLVQSIIEVLCRTVGYFPKPTADAQVKKKAKKKPKTKPD